VVVTSAVGEIGPLLLQLARAKDLVLRLGQVDKETDVVVHMFATLEVFRDPVVRLTKADGVTLLRVVDALDAIAESSQENTLRAVVALALVVGLDFALGVVVDEHALVVIGVLVAQERLVA